MTTYEAAENRYDDATGMVYRFTGRSGLELPVLSLGLWLGRLVQTVARVVCVRRGLMISLLVHMPGIVLGLLAWNAGFSIETFGSWMRQPRRRPFLAC